MKPKGSNCYRITFDTLELFSNCLLGTGIKWPQGIVEILLFERFEALDFPLSFQTYVKYLTADFINLFILIGSFFQASIEWIMQRSSVVSAIFSRL